ncbi:hypothetical protein A2U01_0007187 [Trifolium medium]|uniref:Uncharacterized protein n=1 Tax=Trifolium medium TaxID=97028 RepID=A0A392MFR9_9FABA|nr:hypothetical protein [Trifolium medium]
MDSSASSMPSLAAPTIKQIHRILHLETEDLMEQVDDFSTFVMELKDYSWRLTRRETVFLDQVLRFQKELVADVPFINLVEEAGWIHEEMVTSSFAQSGLIKESMKVQEEILALSFAEEEIIDDKIEALDRDLGPLLKRKKELRAEIHVGVTKLLERRSALVRVQGKQKRLRDELSVAMEDVEIVKKCKHTLEDMHESARDAAKGLDVVVP